VLGLIAAAIVGVLVPAGIDWVSARLGEPAAVAVLSERGGGGGGLESAYAVRQALDAATIEDLVPGEPPDGGVPIGPHEVRVAVTNRRAGQVVVVGMRARVTERSAPISETAVVVRPQGTGGPVPDIPLILDLDAIPAEARVASSVDSDAPASPSDPATAFFGEQSTPIAGGETVIFSITARTASCTCTWVIVLDLLVDGHLEERVIEGEYGGFRTTAPQRKYQAGFEAKPGQSPQWAPLSGNLCLAQCRTAAP
jgi:hypothetical protein